MDLTLRVVSTSTATRIVSLQLVVPSLDPDRYGWTACLRYSAAAGVADPCKDRTSDGRDEPYAISSERTFTHLHERALQYRATGLTRGRW